jgi:hypothetical protein
MRLRERFEEILTAFWISNWEDKCEQVADEHAIGFADWLILKCDYKRHGVFEYLGEEYTNEELLKIYKKVNEKV